MEKCKKCGGDLVEVKAHRFNCVVRFVGGLCNFGAAFVLLGASASFLASSGDLPIHQRIAGIGIIVAMVAPAAIIGGALTGETKRLRCTNCGAPA